MADSVTTQTGTLASIPDATKIATIETASDGHIQRMVSGGGSTCTHSNVSASATNVTLLASNVDRLGATIYNDSVATLYVKLAATASLTSFLIALGPGGYFEVPYGYRGIIDGIWDAASGAARIGEFT